MTGTVYKSISILMLTLVLLSQGLPAPFGISSLAVFAMMVLLPPLATLALARKRSAADRTFVYYNLLLVAVFAFFAMVALINGGLAYQSYLVSIAIQQCFFVACLLLAGAEGVWRSFKFAALVNVGFVMLQMVGGVFGSDTFVKLHFLGVMKGTIEYWQFLPRASGLMTEPAHLSYLLLPPLLVSLLTGRESRKVMRSGRLAMLAAYVLTMSLIAYLQLAIALIIASLRRKSFKALVVAFVGLTVIGAVYMVVPFGHDRVEGLIELASGQSVTKQSSVFSIQSNALVAAASLEKAPILGQGLTSHRRLYEDIINSLFDFPIDDTWLGLNKDDAGSLFLLLLSESGYIGLLLFLAFIIYAILRLSRQRGRIATIGLAHALTLAVVGLRYGQWASVHILLNLQVVLYCLAARQSFAAPATVTSDQSAVI
ncbi:MAG: hypothetical protein ACOH1I_05305 [Gallionellaceae bacterium]